jgi:hypothetical protein
MAISARFAFLLSIGRQCLGMSGSDEDRRGRNKYPNGQRA